MSKYAELHLHSLDQFDSENRPDDVCKRMKELGAVGFALTQHGVLTEIEEMREACEEYGLKFVPGIETYYGEEGDLKQNKHLILLSANYDGYRAIWKAVSESQNTAGFSVMNEEILKKYFAPGTEGHGNVIATSACINGVIAAVLRGNQTIDNEIEKLKRREEKYEVDETRLISLREKVDELAGEIQKLDDEKKSATEVAGRKFAKRQKYVEKLKKEGDALYEIASMQLEAEMKEAEEAKTRIEAIKSEKLKLTARHKALKEELSLLDSKFQAVSSLRRKEAELEAMRKTDDELLDAAAEETQKFLNIFGEGNFYMEIQNHGIPTEADVYPKLVGIARKMGIPLVATNDVHIVTNSEDELLRRRILRSMRFGQWEPDQVGDDQLYIKDDEEMREWLLKIYDEDVVDEAMNNIKVVFDRCNVVFEAEEHYPKFQLPEGVTANKALLGEIRKGAAWRFPEGMTQEYKDRINYEYKIIRDMNVADYHLVVKDFLEYGRALGPVPDEYIDEAPLEIEELKKWTEEHGWKTGFTIGPGRGSAVGSLVCYCLGITNLDPMKYDLLYEREGLRS